MTAGDRLNRVAASVPLTRSAAVVTGKGEHWTPRKALLCATDAWQDTPLPLVPVAPLKSARDMAASIVGFKVCRLTVLGYGGKGSSGARWVVRCACGMYGHNTAKFLRSEGAKTRGMCPRCDYLEQLKRGDGPQIDLIALQQKPSERAP